MLLWEGLWEGLCFLHPATTQVHPLQNLFQVITLHDMLYIEEAILKFVPETCYHYVPHYVTQSGAGYFGFHLSVHLSLSTCSLPCVSNYNGIFYV